MYSTWLTPEIKAGNEESGVSATLLSGASILVQKQTESAPRVSHEVVVCTTNYLCG